MIPEALFKTLFAVFSLGLSLADLKSGMIPRAAFVFAFPVFFVLGLIKEKPLPPGAMLTGALLGLFVFLIAFFVSNKKLGLADVWYSALAGMALGPLRWYAAMSIACVLGIGYMFVSKRRQIPFIPFMTLGSIIAIIIR